MATTYQPIHNNITSYNWYAENCFRAFNYYIRLQTASVALGISRTLCAVLHTNLLHIITIYKYTCLVLTLIDWLCSFDKYNVLLIIMLLEVCYNIDLNGDALKCKYLNPMWCFRWILINKWQSPEFEVKTNVFVCEILWLCLILWNSIRRRCI